MTEVHFRDGKRDVAPHLAELMKSIDTYKLTYDQAIVEVNNRLLSDHLGQVQQKLISQHFRRDS